MAAKKDPTLSKALTTANAGGIQVYQHNAQLPAAVNTQWEYGDWASLKAKTLEAAEQHEARALLVAIIAVAHHQDGTAPQAQPYLQKAVEWGMDKRAIAQIFAAGAYNSLGRAALLVGDTQGALTHFQQSIESGVPGADARLIAPIRASHQGAQMGMQVAIPYLSKPEEPPLLEDDSTKPYTEQLMAIMGSFAQRLVQYGQALVVDGVEVFREKDPFLPGKIAMGLAYWVTEHPSGSAITKQRCQQFRQVMQSVSDHSIESWGIHFYLKALQMLNEADLITECFSFQELVELRKRLDWRSFVNEADYTLIKKPNNFYGIAYSIAYTRYELGWDNLKHSQNLLEKEIDHYVEVSGGEGFADETNGKGRFDRYSFLLIAEIAYRFYEAGLPLTQRMKKWLKASADYVLFNVNDRGDGFQWGRSIGAYGDSAFLEILTAAAVHNLLDKQEHAAACYFARRITHKFITFWYQKDRQSINIWTDGRATDAYRGKHRILGENLSLLHQHLQCHREWERYSEYLNNDVLQSVYKDWKKKLSAAKVTEFKKAECNYSVVTFRVQDTITNIPLINGDRHHNQMAYQPIPFTSGKIDVLPEYFKPILTPIITLSDGKEYTAYPCYENLDFETGNDWCKLSFLRSHLTKLELMTPEKSVAVESFLTYELDATSISGKESFEFSADVDIKSIDMLVLWRYEVKKLAPGKIIYIKSDGSQATFEIFINSLKCQKQAVFVDVVDSVNGSELSLYKFDLTPDDLKQFTVNWNYHY
jgi:hypothetical protein